MGGIINTLFRREIGDPSSPYTKLRTLYSDRRWVDDLDIVNELEGHSGCVNALSWSKSGRLLASGSDDQHLNIHQYHPEDSAAQFRLTTTVATGHTQNIFSVKFMPQSNDRTVVTCAGDCEIRVFDLEYAGRATSASVASIIAAEGRRRGRNDIFNGVKYLSDGDTNCRIYRSHGDRVKRIVTETSPFHFLTCSEDGEVRQWDLRQPSSAYPSPREARNAGIALPPPLISYKQYNLDLNTISCSPSQPHYIALGGAHRHCFLHDRRMAGRDILLERGSPASSRGGTSENGEQLMGQATRCVRKFAPNGQKKMKRTDDGHITACKISDARPDEIIVSWSGEHIYSFDLVRSPDASEEVANSTSRNDSGLRVRESKDGKRKRKTPSELSIGHEGRQRAESRRRTDNMALRVQYQNGQSEDLPLVDMERARDAVLTESQKQSASIAKAVVHIRKELYSLQASLLHTESLGNPVAYQASFSSALSRATIVLPDMDEIMATWRYPMEPSQEAVRFQQTLRRNRERGRRFVQAAGTLARVLGGRLQTPSGTSAAMMHFVSIEARSNHLEMQKQEWFSYEFLKAILLWLDSGINNLIEGFVRPIGMASSSKASNRFPIPQGEAIESSIDDVLIPRLLRLAADHPVISISVNRFEVDENRQLFASEKAAVLAFAAAVKIPFADLSSAVVTTENGHGAQQTHAQNRQTAVRYWGLEVARGVLLNAAQGVDFALVDGAFGGLRQMDVQTLRSDQEMEGESDHGEEPVGSAEVVSMNGRAAAVEVGHVAAPTSSNVTGADADDDEVGATTKGTHISVEDTPYADLDEPMAAITTAEEDTEADDEDNEGDEDHDADSDSDGERDSSEDNEDFDPSRFLYNSAFTSRRNRKNVEEDVPCSTHTRVYRGHCNVKTVKDVNFYGLDDEYVVSGSDDGNLFIWERKSSRLVNILEGDGEVVNVVQGHPYEPMLAVSGIDHTIKIFSPDARAREMARLGQGVSSHDPASFSSIAWPNRLSGRRISRLHRSTSEITSEPAAAAARAADAAEQERRDEEDDNYVALNGLATRRRIRQEYQITNHNALERQGGNQESYITRSMLAQLAQSIRARRAGDGGAEGEEGPLRLEIGDNCATQ